MIAIAGYQVIEKLYEGRRSLVYRGQSDQNGQSIVLKLMQAEYPSLEELSRYRVEYDIINRLKLDGIVRAYGLDKYQNGLVLVLEDFGGESLQTLLQTRHLNLIEFLELAIALVEILSSVHAANVIHKDINPANIVLNPISRQVKLIDFGNATILSRENPSIRNPNVLEGTLPYLSPEQTGRMNRALDYRTDFYSLGATFYQLLTGTPPFIVTDAMELIHCHLAKQPEPPHALQPEIPAIVSQIVLKLLAKNAEDRYQSAYGIKADLQHCLDQLRTTGTIAPFPLAQYDASGKFQIPQKLYGRETEVEMLLSGFDRVSSRTKGGTYSEMMLVAGYSGIGKSALVREIYKPITRSNGYFISGKYDQFQRNIPYSALIRAFQELIRQLLTESPEQIDRWRSLLLTALGSNGQVVVDVIPEVELIIGEQAAVPELAPKATENRFNLVFQKFIQVFTQAEHPLVVFLDDLQWADSASLKFINLLMSDPESKFLFLVGAYRSNEVSAPHRLISTIAEMRKAGVRISQIELSPLALNSIVQLISEAFQCKASEAEPLAELVLQVTDGNPFFSNEFLKSLYEKGLLNFDEQQGCWQWDIAEIRAVQIPDNVVELMTSKIQTLSDRTQTALKLAACVGNQFDSRTLAMISETSQATIASDLWQGVQEGLILPLDENYKFANIEAASDELITSFKFLHDRVQQVAYALISEAERPAIHYMIGQLLLSHTPPEAREDNIFDIVNQLDMGIILIAEQSERDQLAMLNLIAGKKAKDSAAFETATRYLLIGIDLLGTEGWRHQYELALALHEAAAESAYSNGDFAETDRLVDRILRYARTALDRVRAYAVRISAYTAQNNPQAAINSIIDAARRLGETLPRHPGRLRVGLELLYTRFWIVGRQSTKTLEALPNMSDPYKLALTQLLGTAGLASTNVDPLLLAIFALRVVRFTVRYGKVPSSALQAIAYAIMLRLGLEDIDGAYQFCQLTLGLADRSDDRVFQTLAVVAFQSCIRHWKDPLRLTLPSLLNNFTEGLEFGNQEYASLSASVYCIHKFFLGQPLSEVIADFEKYEALMRRFKQEVIVDQTRPWHQLALNLQRETIQTERLTGTAFNEDEMLPIFKQNHLGIPIFYTYIAKTIWLYHAGNYLGALEAAKLAEPLEETAPVTTAYANWYFYRSLACLALCSTRSKSSRRRYLRQVARNQRKTKRWAKFCPENYQHRYDLVEAERSCVLQQNLDAMRYYDRAIQGAKAQEYINEAALANELAAKFYLRLGQERVAQAYLLDARHCYLRWGATFKVNQLDSQYPQLRHQIIDRSSSDTGRSLRTSTAESSSRSSEGNLDLATVVAAAQAISSEIVFDKLLEKLLRLVIENAGAQKGYLLLAQSSELRVEAQGQIDRDPPILVQSRSLSNIEELPLSMINYVQRTRGNVVLSNATTEGLFTGDPYILKVQPKSVLCAPILNQGNLTGIVYLENNLATDTFTLDRLVVLNILSAQAAIALENASFYRTLEQKVEERTGQLAQANAEITSLNERLQSENLRMGAELDITRRLQEMILPKEEELNQIPDLEIAGFMEPADEVGGDYYDVLHNNGLTKIGIGDVTGHGLESGVLMLMLQTSIRTLLANEETNSTQFLSALNRVIYDNVQRMNSERTLTLSLLDYQAGRLRISGQHEVVLVVRSDGTIEQVDTNDLGFMIGLLEDVSDFVAEQEVHLAPGDGVVLYTDGITEACSMAEELYGLDRLCEIVAQTWYQSAQEIQTAVIEDVRRHIGEQKVFDDITLLVIKRKQDK